MIVNPPVSDWRPLPRKVEIMTGGSPPPPQILFQDGRIGVWSKSLVWSNRNLWSRDLLLMETRVILCLPLKDQSLKLDKGCGILVWKRLT
ncbi:hypothetical protein GBA52_025349 [Prunus armeniaca]|nr:hypothetical protein GBA52_025349 [Prunus armeniaca]